MEGQVFFWLWLYLSRLQYVHVDFPESERVFASVDWRVLDGPRRRPASRWKQFQREELHSSVAFRTVSVGRSIRVVVSL